MCTEMATAGLGYDITGARAWLYDLDPGTIAGTTRQRNMVVPLCRTHADRITVPVGWEFSDRRAPVPDPIVAQPEPDAAVEPLFAPRSRPEPAVTEETAEPEPELESGPEPASLLERAFRAAPSRSQ